MQGRHPESLTPIQADKVLGALSSSCRPNRSNHGDHQHGTFTLLGIRRQLALKVAGLARATKYAGGRPRLATVAFDGRYMDLVHH